MFIVELNPEHRAGEHGEDTAFDFDVFFHEFKEPANGSRHNSTRPKAQPVGRKRQPGKQKRDPIQPDPAVKINVD